MLALILASLLAQSDELSEKELRALVVEETAADESSLRQIAEQLLPKVAKVMRLPAPRSLAIRVVSREEAGRKLQDVLKREYPGDRLTRLGIALERVYLLQPGADLQREVTALYSKMVSGFYDPHDRTLYLLKDQPSSMQYLTIAHELAHAVQDEKLGLEQAVRGTMGSEDAQLALSAALEGNAQAVASAVLVSGMEDAETLSELLTEGMGHAASSTAEFGGESAWLAMQMGFPYAGGAHLISAIATKDDPLGLKLLVRPPASTAQVLDARAYQVNERPIQGAIGLIGLIPGAESVYETTLGRANLDLLGEIHANGTQLGEGWRGDRLEVARVGNSRFAAWAIAFSRSEQAERFVTSCLPLLKDNSERNGRRLAEQVHTVSAVSRSNATVVLLRDVPADKAAAIEEAARRALR